jgi:hypothetical protein
MKGFLQYLFVISLLGTFSGLLMSFGKDMIWSIVIMCLFWGLMLAPGLINNKN